MVKKLFIFLILLSVQVSKSQTLFNLEEVSFFPQETDSLLWSNPAKLHIYEDNIFIADVSLNAMLKYNKEGKLLASIDKKGQGPGEFLYPSNFDYGNGKIYLKDGSQARVNIYDSKDFSFLSTFKLLQMELRCLTVHKERLFFVNVSPSLEENESFFLIEEFDNTGKSVRKFGVPFSFIPEGEEVSKWIYDGELRIYKDKLYYLSNKFPVLRVYTLDGILEREIKLELEEEYKNSVKENYVWEDFRPNQTSYFFKTLFDAFDVNEHGVFLLLNYYRNKKLLIDYFDFDGNYLGNYTDNQLCTEKSCALDGFEVEYKNGESSPEFHVLYKSPYPKLSHYKVTDSEVLQGDKAEKSNAWYFILVIGLLVGGFFIFRRMQQRKQVT